MLERWTPFEVAVFEASISLYGKRFTELHKIIRTKSCKEIIEFYYEWKKTHHYKQWKKAYVPDARDTPISIAAAAATSRTQPQQDI